MALISKDKLFRAKMCIDEVLKFYIILLISLYSGLHDLQIVSSAGNDKIEREASFS